MSHPAHDPEPGVSGRVRAAATLGPMARRLLSARALVSHVLVLLVVAMLVTAGLWQVSRLGERRAANALLEERLTAAPVTLDELVRRGGIEPEAWEYRRVTATGMYLPDDELLLEGRSHRGQAGRDVFTPLRLDDGTLVLVRRGWVPREVGAPPVAEATPPAGTVRIDGYLERSVDQPRWGPRNPAEGRLRILQIPDLPRIAPQLDGELFPMILRLVEQDPPPIATAEIARRGLEALPAIYPLEPLDERNHQSYAIQWFSFAVLAVIAYVAWWVTRLREDRKRATAPPLPADTTG